MDVDAWRKTAEVANVLSAEDFEREKATKDIARRFNYIGDTDEESLKALVRARVASYAQAMFDLGIALRLLKQRIPHGGWLAYLNDVGFKEHQAQRAIRVVEAFSVSPEATALARSQPSAAKLLALTAELSSDEIADLASGGAPRGFRKGDLETMTAAEVRSKCREEAEAKEQARQRIKELEEEVAELKRDPLKDSQARAAAAAAGREASRREVDEKRSQVSLDLAVLGASCRHYFEADLRDPDPQPFLTAVFDAILNELVETARDNGVAWDPAIRTAPPGARSGAAG
jgi:hypothetical protein